MGAASAGNGFVDRFVYSSGTIPRLEKTIGELREERYDLPWIFRVCSSPHLIAHLARPERIAGFGRASSGSGPRDVLLDRVPSAGGPCGRSGARSRRGCRRLESGAGLFPLAARLSGRQNAGGLRSQLASRSAGWVSKQWPLEHYEKLASFLQSRLGCPWCSRPGGRGPTQCRNMAHESGLAGLIDATRRAALVAWVIAGRCISRLRGQIRVQSSGPRTRSRGQTARDPPFPRGRVVGRRCDPGFAQRKPRDAAARYRPQAPAPRAGVASIRPGRPLHAPMFPALWDRARRAVEHQGIPRRD